jgi:hypothetical protein
MRCKYLKETNIPPQRSEIKHADNFMFDITVFIGSVKKVPQHQNKNQDDALNCPGSTTALPNTENYYHLTGRRLWFNRMSMQVTYYIAPNNKAAYSYSLISQ